MPANGTDGFQHGLLHAVVHIDPPVALPERTRPTPGCRHVRRNLLQPRHTRPLEPDCLEATASNFHLRGSIARGPFRRQGRSSTPEMRACLDELDETPRGAHLGRHDLLDYFKPLCCGVVHGRMPWNSTQERHLASTDDIKKMEEEFFHLARVALAGRPQDVAMLVRKCARHHRVSSPELAEQLMALLRKTPTRSNPTRQIEPGGLPLDADSRLPLVRILKTPVLEAEPVYDEQTWRSLRQVLRERERSERLAEAGIDPTRTVLFTGPPGVGKTLAAKWIAREMGRPLAILDLSAVMSSFLGRTGGNLRTVLDFARDHDCVLLLDELDAVAKRRDDTTEIGELKRLVTVLLQEIDEWPASGLLLAATNHANLLDPAVWRRFEIVIDFPLPEAGNLEALLRERLGLDGASPWPAVLSRALVGASFSDAFQAASHARRIAATEGTEIEAGLEHVLSHLVRSLSRQRRQEFAIGLAERGLLSQRQVSEITGISRDTIRKHAHPVAEDGD